MVVIQNEYAEAVRNTIRNKSTERKLLTDSLTKIGRIVGQGIAAKYLLKMESFSTPMESSLFGPLVSNEKIVVVSTTDDYKYFGKGIADVFSNVECGILDFAGIRGPAALTSPIRSITLPEVRNVSTVVIAKSVLATGCTAITLTKKAVEKYWPKRVIIASVFYSEQGVAEVLEYCKTAEVFVIGQPDNLRSDGMLIPGCGNIDLRLREA